MAAATPRPATPSVAEPDPDYIRAPGTRHKDLAATCRRQSRLLRDDPQESEVLEWLESVADTAGWR